MKSTSVVVALVALVGCTESNEDVIGSSETISLPAPPSSIAGVVGITLDDTAHLVLAYDTGLLMRYDGTRWTQLSQRATESWIRYEDVVYLDGSRYALAARNDGFVLDVEANTLEQSFCYVPAPGNGPNWMPSPQPQEMSFQVSHGLAYDHASKTIFAMPETRVEGATSRHIATFLATYADDGGDGQPTHWQPLDDAEPADGLAFESNPNGDRLWAVEPAGDRAEISVYRLDMSQPDGVGDLERRVLVDASEPRGLAIDFEGGTAYVLARFGVRVVPLADLLLE